MVLYVNKLNCVFYVTKSCILFPIISFPFFSFIPYEFKFFYRGLGGWKMKYGNSSNLIKDGVETNLPLKGRAKFFNGHTLTIMGQWKEYPQSIFLLPM